MSKMRPEGKEAIRQGMLRYYALHPMSEERKLHHSQGNMGKARSPEWCQHISKAKRGTVSPKKGIPQSSSRFERSKETRSKMSESRKKMFLEHPEMRANLSEKLKGKGETKRVFSQETRLRISQARKQYFVRHPEARLKISQDNKGTSKKSKTRSQTYKQLWQNDDYIKKMIEARNLKPNKE